MLRDETARAEEFSASTATIRAHYDTGNDFFAKWLDPSLCYSAARWEGDADSLAEAQRRKLDWHLAATHVRPGSRLLDVGCGWGALLSAASRRGVRQSTGLTPSREQVDWIRRQPGPSNVRVIEDVWQNADFVEPFDAVISIGALEHFTRPELGSGEKTRAYARFFDFCRGNLRPGGRVSLQFIGWMDVPPEDERHHLPRVLFPESNLPRVEEVLNAAAQEFHLVRLENRPEDYARTLNAWLDRLRANRRTLEESHGRETLRAYVHGFQRFVLGFETGSIGLYRAAWKTRPTARR